MRSAFFSRVEVDSVIVECVECRLYVDAAQAGHYVRLSDGNGPSTRFLLLSCSECRSPILVRQTNVGNLAEGDIWETPIPVFPTADLRVNPNAPQAIQEAFDEACACYRANAFTASAIMCRKTLEGICAVHGVEERSLAASLRKMSDDSMIDSRLFEWSDMLRIAGNEAAHGVGLSIAQADAKDMLEFTNAIMDYLFSYRDRFEAFKARRQQRQNK
ncbi:DUF4145 domain-containing protein [Rhizobium lentis]|uniref:DUF4145 domain-containing protein n=1 Tax=Rhizobium lentis TaxID=1138194 RepID=A0A7W8XIK6_9HYPH|nr:DUF4145 domain-containing protein [Rhizobium lentis]MBB4576616.1 hypothetical protein [Rhizobium lentis]MBB5553017.1 hypothetical protein [Rhizobium lentis]MBB5563464.1 hypothetical protein [Rhizobium lentis]MBB5570002.1 hypothetical protein [Rhizobium lentis]